MRRRGDWIHIEDVMVHRVSTVSEYKAKLGAPESEDPANKVVPMWSLVRHHTAAVPGIRSMRELVSRAA